MPIAFPLGEVVRLKSGGPRMTIMEIVDEIIHCQWFEGTKLKTGRFRPETLERDDGPHFA